MSFQFVDSSNVDPAARRRIRQQAAKGRNAGRPVLRARKPAQTNADRPRPGSLLEKGAMSGWKPRHQKFSPDQLMMMSIERPVTFDMGTVTLPSYFGRGVDVTQRVITFFANPLYTGKLSGINGASLGTPSMWIDLMFVDEAYYHSAMAAGLTALNNACPHPMGQEAAGRHFCMLLRLVGRKLSGAEAVSDATMSAVVMALQYDRYRSKYRDGIVHFAGLGEMVKLRGGLDAVATQNSLLVHKMLRADLEFAMHLGTPTRFFSDDKFPPLDSASILTPGDGPTEPLFAGLPDWVLEDLSPILRSVFVDMAVVSHLFNEAAAGSRPKLPSYNAHHAFLSLGQRLIAFSPLGGRRPLEVLDDMVHVGLVCFVTMLLLGLDGRPAELPLLPKLARGVLERQGKHPANRTLDTILLWVLMAGEAASAFEAQDDAAWFLSEAGRLKEALGLTTWESAREVLMALPWILSVHDAPARLAWQKIA